MPPKTGPATTCVRAQVGASRKGDCVQQGRDEVMICKGLRGLEGAVQAVVALASRWIVGSRSQARNSVGSEPQRTLGLHISNSEIPQLETNLTLEKSTRATFLIAKKSHIADSLFSGTTRTRRRSATDPLAISNRLRRRLEFDVTPGKQRTACDPNRRKWADLIFVILPLRACVLAQPKRRIPKAASLPPVSSLARFSYGVLWPHESAGELAGIVVGQSRRTKWRKIARDRTARSNRT